MGPARQTYLLYTLVSVVALMTDVSAFLLLLKAGTHPVLATTVSYAAGIVVQWVLLTRLVFLQSAVLKGDERLRAKAFFVLSAVAGLLVTAGVVALAVAGGIEPFTAKLIAIAISFNVTYLARRLWVFS